MPTCHACQSETLGRDRFCRNCGAPVATLVEDLVDTNRFSPTMPREPQSAGASSPFQARMPVVYPVTHDSSASYQTGPIVKKLLRRNVIGLIIFLLLSVFIAAGFAIGRRVVRARRAERVEVSRRSVQETIQNSLGFKPGSVSDSEYPGIRGVFIDSLLSDDGPAAVAKIQAGDVVMEVNDQIVRNSAEVAQALDSLTAGAEIAVKLYRDGEIVPLRVKIADRSFPPLQQRTNQREQGFMGIEDSRRRCCVPGTQKRGVEITGVVDNGPAYLAGLESGDLITEFDGYAVRTSNEFNRRIRAAKPRSRVMVTFYRGNTEQTAELTLGRR